MANESKTVERILLEASRDLNETLRESVERHNRKEEGDHDPYYASEARKAFEFSTNVNRMLIETLTR